MAIAEETRTSLIGLSVVMLGSAPGADLLNEWTVAHEGGLSLEDIANRIAASEAFLAAYPAFLTNGEFASSLLGGLLAGEAVPAEVVAAAADIAAGLLNEGMSRGALALAALQALDEIGARGAEHPAFGELGAVALALANRIEVAEYYTVELRQSGPSGRVLRGVDSATGLDDIIDGFAGRLDPRDPIPLTNARDNIKGTAEDDLIVAEPDRNGNDTLDYYDTVDGGAGYDTLEIYSADTAGLELDSARHADVSSVEHVRINARGPVEVDLTQWDGLESVEIGRHGMDGDAEVKVDGAAVAFARDPGGNVLVDGAGGALDLKTGGGARQSVEIATRGHTISATVDARADAVVIDADGAGGKSGSLTTVSASGFASLTVSSDRLETLVLSSSATGVAELKYGNSEELSVNAAAFGGGQAWTEGGSAYETESALALTADDDAKSAVKTLAIDVSAASRFNLKSEVEHLTVSGSAPLYLQLDHFEDKAGELYIDTNGDAAGGEIVLTAERIGTRAGVAADKWITLSESGNVAAVSDNDPGGARDYKVLTRSDGGDDAEDDWFTTTLKTITVTGAASLETNVAGQAELTVIDASKTSGDVEIAGIGGKVESFTGGAGDDFAGVAAFREEGIVIDLGAGNDTYRSAGGNAKSRVDGGEGEDTLWLTDAAADLTYKDAEDKDKSIYAGFEILDVSGGAGAYDVERLGVNRVVVGASTAEGGVELLNLPPDAGLVVTALSGAQRTEADLTIDLKGEAGVPFPRAGDGSFTVSLLAQGPYVLRSGAERTLTRLSLDSDLPTVVLDSSVINPYTPEFKETYTDGGYPLFSEEFYPAFYRNNVLLQDPDGSSSLETIKVTGDAWFFLRPQGAGGMFSELRIVDASENTAGVNLNFQALTQDLVLLGTDSLAANIPSFQIADAITGGAGNDTIQGGVGLDRLRGNGGNDTFVYTKVSDSTHNGQNGIKYFEVGGYDNILDWGSEQGNDDTIALPKDLFATLRGVIKKNGPLDTDGDGANDTTVSGFEVVWVIDSRQPYDSDSTPNFWADNAEGFFETSTDPVAGAFGATVNKHSIAVFTTAANILPANTLFQNTFIVIYANGNGDFDPYADMVIVLSGNHAASIGPADFISSAG